MLTSYAGPPEWVPSVAHHVRLSDLAFESILRYPHADQRGDDGRQVRGRAAAV